MRCSTATTRAAGKGHVGFFLRIADGRIHLLGGNQLEQVREHDYPVESVLGYRWPHHAVFGRSFDE